MPGIATWHRLELGEAEVGRTGSERETQGSDHAGSDLRPVRTRHHLDKAPRTQRDNLAEFRQLRNYFDKAPNDGITPAHMAKYRDIRANREIAKALGVKQKRSTRRCGPCLRSMTWKEPGHRHQEDSGAQRSTWIAIPADDR